MMSEAVYVGVDVSKDHLDVHVYPCGLAFRAENTLAGRNALMERLKPLRPLGVGFEASGGYEEPLRLSLGRAKLPACRTNPLRVRNFARARGYQAKTDRIDAAVIAEFTAKCGPRETVIADNVVALAEFERARKSLVQQSILLSSQIRRTNDAFLVELHRFHLKMIKEQIAEIDNRANALVEADETLRTKARIIRSIPGVGPVLTRAMLALMPELGSIANREASALLGVAPIACDSGRMRGQRHIFGGRKDIRDIAYMAALVAKKHNPVLAQFAKRLADKNKKPKVVVVAVIRKLVVMLNAMLKSGKAWDNNFIPSPALG